MSRLIVKNLPKNITDERVKTVFAEMGQITDIKLKYTKNGVFRRFAFVGFKTHTEAQRALKHFNNTFIDTSKIQVDICKDLGDETAPRPWSKYSEKSSAFQKKAKQRKRALDGNMDEEKPKDEVKKKRKKKGSAMLEELENDSSFQEFLEVHKTGTTKNIWNNDEEFEQWKKDKKYGDSKENVDFEDSSGESDDENDIGDNKGEDEEPEMDIDEQETGSKEAANIALSDMDYLKKKITSDDKLNESTAKAINDKKKKMRHQDAGNKESNTEEKKESLDKETLSSKEKQTENKSNMEDFERKSDFTIKLRGLPFHAKKKDIEDFLSPLNILDVRLPKDSKNRPSGRAYVDLESKDCIKEALKRHKDYIKGRYIEVFEDKRFEKKKEADIEPPWMKNAKELEENKDLSIAETGRLYLRNLSYACTEEELLELFSKYGPTTEVFVPIDKHSNISMGFAFVTFMMPEHAVQAFNELDGRVFQGRIVHILPAKPKRNTDTGDLIKKDEDSSFKKKQKAQMASLKNKEHNWNALFLGVNAVAEIMADKYNSSKSDVLNVQSKDGLALRMALGETQVVAETKEFLVNHGVKLDAFGQADAKRSKTVIIVKNLQHGTNPQDLENLFSSFGHLGKVILPPSGVTALVEFEKLSSAANAFEKIAYTKFNGVPLYLEWAPADVFDTDLPSEENELDGDQKDNDDENELSAGSGDEIDGHVLFVKNLNFDTSEESLKELFSEAGKVSNVTIAKKKDSRNKGAVLSMGYGFIEYKTKKAALNAIKKLQNYELDGHSLELKMSNKKRSHVAKRKSLSGTKQKSSKILVRNVPFEATQKELTELFGTFGDLKTVRLPKKLSGTGPHRGFAFIDFLTKRDAKRAFKSLCTSTHLYGRRLVLEWADDTESIDELRKKTADYFHEPIKKVKSKDLTEELDG